MNYHILPKFKKYILILSIVIFFVTWSHLSYLYLIHDAEFEAIPWGTISEAIIGNFPHFNPLIPSNDHNAYINSLLFRSLLQYDFETWKFQSDIASCNLERLNKIECIIEDNVRWSNGQNITADDIIATFDIIRQTQVNPLYATFLEDITIAKNGNVMSFTTNVNDINILSLFLQPILPKNIIDTLNAESVEWKLSDVNGVFSGIFTVSNIILDEATWVSRITLKRNENYFQNPTYIEHLIINLFRDEVHLLQNRNNSFNIKYDKNHIIWSSIPRLRWHDFMVPQFSTLFYNTQNIDTQLRRYLVSQIEREKIIKQLWENKVTPIYNPFFTERLIETPIDDTFSFTSYLASKGYYPKNELLRQVDERTRITEESLLFADTETQNNQAPEQANLSIVKSPTTQKYNFVSSDNILIEWNVPAGVSAVYINDYRLQWFSQWDNVFFYRLLKNFDSIQDGENNYDIYFEIDNEKVLQESFYYYLNEDETELEKFKSNFFQESTSTTSWENNSVQINDLLDIQVTREEIEALDWQYFYNTEWQSFNLKIISVQADILLSETLQIIIDTFQELWVTVFVENLSLSDLTAWLRDSTVEYDIVLLWIDIWNFTANIFPYLHSSQVQNWYNLSRFSELGLDILVEELRSWAYLSTQRWDIEEKILNKLEENIILQTLYTNKHSLLLDRNIQKSDIPKKFRNTQARHIIFNDMFFNESKQINWENKSIIWGLRFIVSQLF